jgi:hypothetical protein
MLGATVSSNLTSKAMKRFRILMVDDDGLFRQVLKESLQIFFPKVAIEEVADGGEVLREADAFLNIRKPLSNMGPIVFSPRLL